MRDLPKTGPECHPRVSISAPYRARPARGPVSKPAMAAMSRSRPVMGRSFCVASAPASRAGMMMLAECKGAPL